MPGQFVQNDSTDMRIGIPRVVRLDALVTARIQFIAQQSVVLDVIDTLKEQESDDPCPYGEQHRFKREHVAYHSQISRLNEMIPKHVVFGRKEGQLLALQQLRLESPCIDVLLGHRCEPKTIDGLVVPCSGSIFRCGHVHVVAKIVFDKKVHVQARHVQELSLIHI